MPRRWHFSNHDHISHDNSALWKLLFLKKAAIIRLTFDDMFVFQLFVKGVVNPEEQQEVQYPQALHCIFCGARGLFMDSLIRSTSAVIVVSLQHGVAVVNTNASISQQKINNAQFIVGQRLVSITVTHWEEGTKSQIV